MPKKALTADRNEYASTGAELAASIRRTLRILLVATVVLFLAILAVAGYTYSVSRDNQDALCVFRADLQQRISTTQEFLIKNKSEEPIPGVTRQTLLTNLQGQVRTVKAFSNLNCPALPPVKRSG